MANIGLLNLNFVDGSTRLNADRMNAIVSKMNELVAAVNNGSTPVQETVATPVINISGNTAIITCATSGATIKYTTDGSTPSASNGSTYSSAITLSASCTIKAVAIKSGMTTSSVASQSYTAPVTVTTPTITINGSSVTITAESGATLRYTTDGSTPSASSGTAVNSNTVTFTPSGDCTIKAVAIKSNVVSSVASQSYTAPSAGETWQSEDLGSALSTIINKDNVWAISESNYSRMIPAVPGRQYKIEAAVNTRGAANEDGAFAFLTNNDTTAGNTPSYAGDAEGLSIVVYGAEPTIVTAPSNAAYLYIADFRDGNKWGICNVSSLR